MKTPTIPIFIIEENLKKEQFDLKKNKKILEKKNLSWNSWLKKNFKNFCSKTELQGFNYIVRPENSIIEKHSWAGIIIAVIIVTIVLLYLSYTWDANIPTITVISKPFFPVWNIPFPAVTICHLNLISKKKMEKLLETIEFPDNKTIPNKVIIEQIRKILYYTSTLYNEKDYNQLRSLMEYNNLTVYEIKKSLVPDCNDMIVNCKWKGETKLCQIYFQKINTSEGICCSFNYYAHNEDNFPENIRAQIPDLPRKISGSHFKVGLTVILDSQIDDYMATYFSCYGFRLFIHDAYDYPDENAEIKILNSKQGSFIRIVPEQVKATPAIRQLPLTSRNCYFRDEYKLNSFRNYSYINCLAECRATKMYKACGCIPLRSVNNGSIPICNFDQIPCVMEYRGKFISGSISSMNRTAHYANQTLDNGCEHCLPSCEFNIYQVDLSTSRLNMEYSYSSRSILKNITNDEFVLLHIFYGDLYTNLYLTDLFQDWISTLAVFGGIVGLLSNINLMSIFEFTFYMFLKPSFSVFENDSDDSD